MKKIDIVKHLQFFSPFATHAGSDFSCTESCIKDRCLGATLLYGFDVPGTTAQNEQDEIREKVQECFPP